MKTIICILFVSTAVWDGSDMKKVSYAIGSQMGESLTSQGVELDIDSFIQGIRDGIAGTSTMKAEEISQIMMAFQTEMREKQNQMRFFSSSALEKADQLTLAASCSAADAMVCPQASRADPRALRIKQKRSEGLMSRAPPI